MICGPGTEARHRKGRAMEAEIANLVMSLFSSNGMERQRARLRLVKIGRPVITFLIGLQYSRNQQVRWEAIKILSDIHHPDSIPILVNALENSNTDVRWLAAEGLVELGEHSVLPLMEALEERGDSRVLREGVHHVLSELKQQGRFDDTHGILKLLRTHSLLAELRPTAAEMRAKG